MLPPDYALLLISVVHTYSRERGGREREGREREKDRKIERGGGEAWGRGRGRKENGGGGGGGGGDNLLNYSGILYPGDKLFRNRLSGG